MHRRIGRCLQLPDHHHHRSRYVYSTLKGTSLKQRTSNYISMTTTSTSQQTMWQQRLPVDGQLTDVWGIDPPPHTTPALQILIIPGNPGLGSYYIPFMHALQQHMDVPCALRCLSHVGQDIPSMGNPGYSLADQIQHKVAFMRQHMTVGPHASPIVVMGHSIGAHMAVHAVHALESESVTKTNIASVIGLFPFFMADPTSSTQWRIQRMVQWPGLIGGMVSCMRLLPVGLQRRLVGAYGGLDDEHAVHATLSLLHPHQVRNAFVLAQHEFVDLHTPDINWHMLQTLGSRLLLIAAPNDVWLPDSQWCAMQTKLPNAALWWEPEQVHAFCVSAARSDQLAQKLARLHLHHGRRDEATVPQPKAMQHTPPAGLPM